MSQRTLRASAACCVFVLVSVLGCGSDSDDGNATDTSTTEPAPSESGSPGSDTSTGAGGHVVVGGSVEPGQAVIVSASNVDGETAERASALVDKKSVEAFVSATDARLAADVRTAIEEVQVPDDSTLFGAVVSVGCHTPTGITWSTTFEGIEVSPVLPKTKVQCLVPVTSVALFLVPN